MKTQIKVTISKPFADKLQPSENSYLIKALAGAQMMINPPSCTSETTPQEALYTEYTIEAAMGQRNFITGIDKNRTGAEYTPDTIMTAY